MISKIFLALVVIAALMTGWQIIKIDAAYGALRQAPQGQESGAPDAKIVIVELMDYRCAPCRKISETVRQVQDKHPEVHFVYRHLPIYKEPSVREARMALAAGMQGKFKAMHDLLMTRTEPVEDKEIEALCTQVGANCPRLQNDMKSTGVAETLLRTLDLVQILEIKTAPTFVVGKTIYGARDGLPTVADFDRIIAAAKEGRRENYQPLSNMPATSASPH